MTSELETPRGTSRREFIAIGVGAFAVASLPIALSRHRTASTRRTIPVMGTIAELLVAHRDPGLAEDAITAAIAELQLVETTMTRFDPRSDIGRANRVAARDGVAITAGTAAVVGEALRWASTSNGAYDPAIGEAIQLWDVTHRHEPPADAPRRRLAGRQLYRHVDLDTNGKSARLRFEDRDVSIDLGAIAKGYGVDRAIAVLRARGIEHAVVDVGGDLYALGTAPEGDKWRIGIQDPDDARRMRGTLELADQAAATSGTYIQYFKYRGVRYHHLLDPRTASPRAVATQSITVVADSCMHADVAATTLFGMPDAEARRVLAIRAPGARVASVI